MYVIPEIVKNFIFGFHMPLFYYLSGYCFNENNLNMKTRKYIMHKAKRILAPYITYVIVFGTLNIMQNGGSLFDFLNFILDIFVSGSGGYTILWFFLSLFWVEMFFYVSKKYFGKNGYFICSIFILIGFFLGYIQGPNIAKLSTSGAALLYYLLGYLVRRYDKSKFFPYMSNKGLILIIAVILLASNVCLSIVTYRQFGWKINWCFNQHIFFGIELFLAVSGIACVCIFCIYMQNIW